MAFHSTLPRRSVFSRAKIVNISSVIAICRGLGTTGLNEMDDADSDRVIAGLTDIAMRLPLVRSGWSADRNSFSAALMRGM